MSFSVSYLQDDRALRAYFQDKSCLDAIRHKKQESLSVWQKTGNLGRLALQCLASFGPGVSATRGQLLRRHIFSELSGAFFNMRTLARTINLPRIESASIYELPGMPVGKLGLTLQKSFEAFQGERKKWFITKLKTQTDELVGEVISRLVSYEKTENPERLATLRRQADAKIVQLQALCEEKVKEAEEDVKNIPGIVEFKGLGGICKGSVQWFAYLYLCSKDDFANVEEQLTAVSEEFRYGAPPQALLLQALNCAKEFLDLDFICEKEIQFRKEGKSLFSYIPPFVRLWQLQPGVYQLVFPKHAMLLVKPDIDTAYVFDPAFGLFRIENFAQFSSYFYLHTTYVDMRTLMVYRLIIASGADLRECKKNEK